MMVQWQCRNPACAWQGRWYECFWDGLLSLYCPCCGDVCDPDLEESHRASVHELLVHGSGCLMLLLGFALLWRFWDRGPIDLLTAMALLGGAVGCIGCGLLGLVPALLLKRSKR